ncbi:hypothetical protein [Amphritea pacifica]|uniref:hypothetical protein n=1 Tax=Amphritea pacifica TaxID=2811233 RepID=UPI001962E11B|nr:hypothetical protein [Amphritea pacifica]MBN1006134.1 hypothetical protein [Amphritea pacifica]
MNESYELSELTKIDNQCILVAFSLLVACFLCWNFGWSGYFMPDYVESDSWFQRSGSLSLVFCIFSELFLIKKLSSASIILSKNPDAPQPFSGLWFNSLNNFVKIMIHFLTVSSTLICGYGDVIYKSIVVT